MYTQFSSSNQNPFSNGANNNSNDNINGNNLNNVNNINNVNINGTIPSTYNGSLPHTFQNSVNNSLVPNGFGFPNNDSAMQQQQHQHQHQHQHQPYSLPSQQNPLPNSREALQKLYLRWQALKNANANESTNPEFASLCNILRMVSRQQEGFRQKFFHHQTNNSQIPTNSLPSNNMLPSMPTNDPSGTPLSSSFPDSRIQQSQPSSTLNQSINPLQSQNNKSIKNSPTPTPIPSNSSENTEASFTPQQLNTLKGQIMAFKMISRNLPVPGQLTSLLFNSSANTPSSKTEPTKNEENNNSNNKTPTKPVMEEKQPTKTQDSQKASKKKTSVTKTQKSQDTTFNKASSTPPQSKTQSKSMIQSNKENKVAEPQNLSSQSKLAVSPYSYLLPEISYKDYQQRQNRLMIPSIMPVGEDILELKQKRERVISNRIASRIDELESLPANFGGFDANNLSPQNPPSDSLDKLKIKALIELKGLKLLNLQRRLRHDVALAVAHLNSLTMSTHRAAYRRMKKQSLLEARLTEELEKQQRLERDRRERQKHLDYLQNVISHGSEILIAGRERRTRMQKTGKAVTNLHYQIEREEQKRIERTAKQRLQALKANDEEAYLKLLDQTKDTRITHLLKQTNVFLESLANSVKEQQKESADPNRVREMSTMEDDELNSGKVDYYAVAHKIKEVVTKQPSILVGGTLKDYQLKGLQWMVSLYNNNLNGILADEMGLGKTIQTLSLITYLIETKGQFGPFLVIVPLSTITNWTLEFEKWAPAVRKVVYKGTPAARKAQQGLIKSGDFQVCLTTYEYVIKDRPILSKIRWLHMIIDEGHRMKNTQSKLSYTLTQYYHARYRLILTGTPLQNNLPELWALLNFALPKIFNSAKSFDEWFNTPFANTGGGDQMNLSEEEALLIIRRLHKVLRPFLLRRLKKDVEKDLPDKVETVIKCKMSALQYKMYQLMLKHNILFIGEDDNKKGAGLKGLNNRIMQLRKICNHPFVFEEVENFVNPSRITNDELWRVAGKFELLDRILPKFKATGHKILIFFQMTQVMDIMEDYMRLKGYQYLRLDGGTKADDRSVLLKLFNAPDSPYFCFLLSTRAGGLGLNLQSADTVIIYDTDWNPHQDLQAQDRAHRIGQTHEVRILRLITQDSVEEMILERAHKKLELDGKVIQAGKFDNKSTNEEQEAFLRSLLESEESRRGGQEENEEEELDDEELNEIISRSDEERKLFEELDIERARTEKYGKGHAKERLMGEDELPEVYKHEYKEVVANSDEVTGRGARERKVTHYDDGLTEEQWLEAIDNDDDNLEDAIARKRARINKRHENKVIRERETSTLSNREDSIAPASETPVKSSTPVPPPSTKRKRPGRPKMDGTEPVRKRSKGRPAKVKELLPPKAREVLQEQIQRILDNINLLEEPETNRRRSDLFAALPDKRLYPDYFVLITRPIAIDIIQKKISNKVYMSLDSFVEDLKLMFNNAKTYNEEGSMVYEDAEAMNRTLIELYKPAKEAFEAVFTVSDNDDNISE